MLNPEKVVLTKEIKSWRGFIQMLSTYEDKDVQIKLLSSRYEYSIAINCESQTHPFPLETLTMGFVVGRTYTL